jgi:SAM-dependent methyltransferase
MSYESSTRLAYRSDARAADYQRYQKKAWTWGRLVTWREQRRIAGVLRAYTWTPADRVLDVPAGTGILADVLAGFPFSVVASDISREMMALGRHEYARDRLLGCLQGDITQMPFRPGSFSCVLTLGFLHRVPVDVKRSALREIASLSSRLVIVTCSVDTLGQRLKQRAIAWLRPRHVPAPCPVPLSDLVAECEAHGLRVARAFMVLPFLSSEAVLVLEKRDHAPVRA